MKGAEGSSVVEIRAERIVGGGAERFAAHLEKVEWEAHPLAWPSAGGCKWVGGGGGAHM